MSGTHRSAYSPLFQPGSREGSRRISAPPVAVGLPPGGLPGQYLGKLSDADYDVGWIDVEGCDA